MINKCFNPFPEFETERLILRKIKYIDERDLYKVLSNPEVAKFDYFYPVEKLKQVRQFISRYNEEIKQEEEITWGIILKQKNKLIGTCGLGNFEAAARRAEIGYALAEDFWGNGYGTEAVAKAIAFGFNTINLNRIEATVTPGNQASINLLRKLHFKQEGIVRQRDFIKGKLEDGVIMALLKDEYVY
ncbi:MAG: GNAT family N-acetyltransferase [Cellulosilyticaceae bacterium]